MIALSQVSEAFFPRVEFNKVNFLFWERCKYCMGINYTVGIVAQNCNKTTVSANILVYDQRNITTA